MKYVFIFFLLAMLSFAQYEDPYATQQNSNYIKQLNAQQTQQPQPVYQPYNPPSPQPQPTWQPMGGVDLRGPDLR